VSNNLFDILPWNWKVDEYIAIVFDFVEKFLAFNGLCYYFTQMTSEFIRKSLGLIWKAMAS
jgi:hypothetical protein